MRYIKHILIAALAMNGVGCTVGGRAGLGAFAVGGLGSGGGGGGGYSVPPPPKPEQYYEYSPEKLYIDEKARKIQDELDRKDLTGLLKELKGAPFSQEIEPDNRENPSTLRAYFRHRTSSNACKQITKAEYDAEIKSDPLSVTMAECYITEEVAKKLLAIQKNPSQPWYCEIPFFDEYGFEYVLSVNWKANKCFALYGNNFTMYNNIPLLEVTDLDTIAYNGKPATEEEKKSIRAAIKKSPEHGKDSQTYDTKNLYEKILDFCNSSTQENPAYVEIPNKDKSQRGLFYLGKNPDGSLIVEKRNKRYIDILQKIPHVPVGQALTGDGFDLETDEQGNLYIVYYKGKGIAGAAQRLGALVGVTKTSLEKIKILVTPSIALRLCDLYYKNRDIVDTISKNVKLTGSSAKDKKKKYTIKFVCDDKLKIKSITDASTAPTTK